MPKYIKADQFFYPQGIRKGGFLEVTDGKFGKLVQEVPADAEVVDYTGYLSHQVWWIPISMVLVGSMSWTITSKEPFIL